LTSVLFLRHHHKGTFPYQMSNKLLKVIEQHSYLWIIIDHRLSWGPQVNNICNKETRLIGFLQRNLQNFSQIFQELSFKQFILPVLEYAGAAWNPYHLKDISKLEVVQHRFVLNWPWHRNLRDSISEMLASLNGLHLNNAENAPD